MIDQQSRHVTYKCYMAGLLVYHLLYYLPSSPPKIEKSRGKIVHFWMIAACDTALALALSIPACMALLTISSFPGNISSTVVAWLPIDLHQYLASCVNSFVGAPVVGFISTYLKAKIQSSKKLLVFNQN